MSRSCLRETSFKRFSYCLTFIEKTYGNFKCHVTRSFRSNNRHFDKTKINASNLTSKLMLVLLQCTTAKTFILEHSHLDIQRQIV